jgi:hypothetical protein
MDNMEEGQVEKWKDMNNTEERQAEQWKDMKKHGRKTSWIVIRFGKYRRK